jgi:4-amino-4-deoxy-L-arabinose transferase-like glycosyltransferase
MIYGPCPQRRKGAEADATVDGVHHCPHTLAIMIWRSRPLRLIVCATFAAILYLPALGRPALWEPDEGRYAEIAREMVLTQDWVTPHDNWVRYFEKPPLVYWAEAAAISALGPVELAVRLPAALSTVASVAITAALGEAMFGAATGLAGAAVLALCPLVFGFARFATLDPTLAMFFTAALGAFWASARTPGFESVTSRRWFLLAAALAAAGTLAKGPVALVLIGVVAIAELAVERRAREILQIPWLWASLVYLVIAAPWFVLAARRNAGFVHFFFIHEHVERYLESSEHGWGPYFLLAVVIGGTWPWICFVPLGVRELLRADGTPAASAPSGVRGSLRFLLLWFAIVLVFFSIPRSKLGSYILPALPPLAIVAGYALCRLPRLDARAIRRSFATVAILNLIATDLAAATLLYLAGELNLRLIVDGFAAICAITFASLVSLTVTWRGRNVGAALCTLGIGVVVALGLLAKARMDAQPLGSYRLLARAVAPYLDQGCRLASYRHFVQSLPFYTGDREALVDYRGELAPFGASADAQASFIANDQDLARLWQGPGCAVLIVNRSDVPHIRATLRSDATVVACEGKKFALYNHDIPLPPTARACVAEIGP